MFYPYEGYRSVTPLDAARVNRTTIFHHHLFVQLLFRKARCSVITNVHPEFW